MVSVDNLPGLGKLALSFVAGVRSRPTLRVLCLAFVQLLHPYRGCIGGKFQLLKFNY